MLVARVASGKVGFAEVMAPKVRWRCLIRFKGIRGHRPRFARPPRMPKSTDGILGERGISYLGVASNDFFFVIPKSADGILAILLLSISLEQAQIRLFVKVLRREGDSNPRNPFGVYTLSRRASSTTRASLLRRNERHYLAY